MQNNSSPVIPKDWKLLVEKKLLEHKQFKSTGLSSFHHGCLCTLQFQDFLKDFTKLRQKVETHPHLQQNQMDKFSSFALETVASKMQEERPSSFHNTFVFLNGDCILQLKNKEKLNTLKQQNQQQLEERMKRLLSGSVDIPDKETVLSQLRARLEVPEKEQFWTPESKNAITNTNLTFSLPEGSREVRLLFITIGITMLGIGVIRGAHAWKTHKLKKKLGL